MMQRCMFAVAFFTSMAEVRSLVNATNNLFLALFETRMFHFVRKQTPSASCWMFLSSSSLFCAFLINPCVHRLALFFLLRPLLIKQQRPLRDGEACLARRRAAPRAARAPSRPSAASAGPRSPSRRRPRRAATATTRTTSRGPSVKAFF